MGRASVLCPRAGGGTPTVGTCPAAAVGQQHLVMLGIRQGANSVQLPLIEYATTGPTLEPALGASSQG